MIRPCPWGRERVSLKSNDLTVGQKDWLGWAQSTKTFTRQILHTRFGIPKPTLKDYMNRFNAGLQMGSVGRPRVLTNEDEVEYLRFINEHEKRNHSPTEAKNKLRELQLARAGTRGIHEINVHEPSRRTINRIHEKLDVHINNAESSTTARDEACAEKINQVLFAGMQQAVSIDTIFPHLIGNVDATQYTFKLGSKGAKVIWNKKPKQFKSFAKKQTVEGCYFVKYYLCIFAGGTVGPAVYIIADPNMKEGEIKVQSVPGLGIGTDVTNSGHIVFVKERGSLPKAFYEWWVKECLVPTIEKIRQHHALSDEKVAWFQLAGWRKVTTRNI